jgi:uncharacterized membrane protein YidH (DUF202 family)
VTGTHRSGRQPERTLLAWTRTSLSAFAAGILLVKLGASYHNTVELIGGAWSMACAVIFGVLGRRSLSRRARSSAVIQFATISTLALAVITVVAVCVAEGPTR